MSLGRFEPQEEQGEVWREKEGIDRPRFDESRAPSCSKTVRKDGDDSSS